MTRSAAPLLLLAALLAGCQTAEPPAITLVDIRPIGVTAFETSAEVDLRITNPGPVDLTLNGASHKLAINGSAIGTATADQPLTVAAFNSAIQTCRLHINHLAIAARLREITEKQRFDYALTSTLHPAGALFPIKATTTGTFNTGPADPGDR